MSINREITDFIEQAKGIIEQSKNHHNKIIGDKSIYHSENFTEAKKEIFKKQYEKSFYEYNEQGLQFLELNNMRVPSNQEKLAQIKIKNLLI